MGGLKGLRAGERLRARLLALLLASCVMTLALGPLSCSSTPEPKGFYYAVQSGDNLYRIGKRFGVSPETLIEVNQIRDVRSVSVGTRLYITAEKPRGGAASTAKRSPAKRDSGAAPASARKEAKQLARLTFAWPVRGKLTSRFGRRNGRPHEGIDMAAKKGTPIRAAESGKVIHSGRLGAYGKVVIVKHQGDYRSVYAHTSKTHVKKGQFVDRGEKIAEVGSSGKASGPHLHFEIRRRQAPQDPMLYLP